MGELLSSSGSDLRLSSELLADAVREASERFNEGVPWGWMLDALRASLGCQRAAVVSRGDDGAVVLEAACALDEAQREALLRGDSLEGHWLRVVLAHAGRVEATAFLDAPSSVDQPPRWVELVCPVWAAMIAARRAEAQRRATEASYRELFEGAADALFVADTRLRYIDVNARACDALGFTRAELLGFSVSDLVAPDDLSANPLARARLDQGELVRSSRRLRCKDGSHRWFELATRRLPDGRYVAIARDVQDQRAAEERLRRSEESFRALIEAMPDGIVIHRAGVIVYANPAAHSMLRMPEGQRLEGRSVLSMLHPDDYAVAAERIRALASGMTSVPPTDERFVRADGQVLHAEVIALRSVFQGEPAVVAVGRDRTEARRMRAELAHADRVSSVGRLAAGVAHEVNNPLTYVTLHLGAVSAAVDAMREGASPPDEAGLGAVAEALRTVSEGVDRVRRIVRDLKTFSRQDDDRPARIDLRETLESALNLASHELIARVRVVREYAPLPAVEGIEGRLCQVFLNLFVNAAQAIPDDGAEHTMVVRARREGSFVRVDVIDDGVGVPAALRERIFEPFFSTRRSADGTGLGLSICADIVRAHGGHITLQSEEGRGSEFSVFLPVAGASDAGAEALPPPGSSLPPGRVRVLAVDDEPAVLAGVVRALGGEHAVTTVGCAADALRLLERGTRFDVVLCDVLMPGMNGPEFLDEVRSRWPSLAERVLLMMGGSSRDARKLVGEGQTLLSKPFNAATLREAVVRALERASATTPARAPEGS